MDDSAIGEDIRNSTSELPNFLPKNILDKEISNRIK